MSYSILSSTAVQDFINLSVHVLPVVIICLDNEWSAYRADMLHSMAPFRLRPNQRPFCLLSYPLMANLVENWWEMLMISDVTFT